MNAINPEIEYNFVIGKSPQIQEVYRQMQTAAKGAGSVLIAGESGTGKTWSLSTSTTKAVAPRIPLCP